MSKLLALTVATLCGIAVGVTRADALPPRAPALTLAEIQPCFALMDKDPKLDPSETRSLEHWNSNNPFGDFPWTAENIKYWLQTSREHIASLQSGDREEQAKHFTHYIEGQEAIDKIANERAFDCQLGVRLRQLQRGHRKK